MGAAQCCNADKPHSGGPPLEHEARMNDFSAEWFQEDDGAVPRASCRKTDVDGKGEWGTAAPNPVVPIGAPMQDGMRATDAGVDVSAVQTHTHKIVSAADAPPRKFTRKDLVDVAHENYVWRSNWRVPESIAVTHDECMAGLKGLEVGGDSPVTFSSMLTGDALLYFSRLNRDSPLCGLNFANGKDVGGGYKTGATAQEEDLCRQIPNLFPSLLRAQRAGLYPFGPPTCSSRTKPAKYSDVLYTQGLTVARAGVHGEYKPLCDTAWAQVSLVTAAAPNINFANDVYDLELMYHTVKTIFLSPLLRRFHGRGSQSQGHRQRQSQRPAIVLGAWGCGAFGCNPVDIGGLFARALVQDGLGRFYREVHFAIPSGPNADAFKEAFRSRGISFRELGEKP